MSLKTLAASIRAFWCSGGILWTRHSVHMFWVSFRVCIPFALSFAVSHLVSLWQYDVMYLFDLPHAYLLGHLIVSSSDNYTTQRLITPLYRYEVKSTFICLFTYLAIHIFVYVLFVLHLLSIPFFLFFLFFTVFIFFYVTYLLPVL